MNPKLIGAVALAATCLVASYLLELGPFEPELELNHERFYLIKAEIKKTPNAVVVFGDSIAQGANLPAAICGHPVINAGVVGAGVQYFQHHAAALLGSSHPKLIVLAVGINNASPTAGKQFQSNYREIVAALSRVAPVAVGTITPVRKGSEGYDPTLVTTFNEVIKMTPNSKAVIDLNKPLSGANWTTDGIHLGAAGNALWTKAMIDGVRRVLDCTN